MSTRERGPTEDALFLAITREASVYGVSVPLGPFLLLVMSDFAAFGYSYRYNLLWRAVLCLTYLAAGLLGMAALTSWEPRWWQILCSWAQTRGQVILSRWTRHHGGSTYRPWPCAIQTNRDEMRDHAG